MTCDGGHTTSLRLASTHFTSTLTAGAGTEVFGVGLNHLFIVTWDCGLLTENARPLVGDWELATGGEKDMGSDDFLVGVLTLEWDFAGDWE